MTSYKEKFSDNLPKWKDLNKFDKITTVFLATGTLIIAPSLFINAFLFAFQVSNIFSQFFLIFEYIGTFTLLIGLILFIID